MPLSFKQGGALKALIGLLFLFVTNTLLAGTPAEYLGEYNAKLLDKDCYTKQFNLEGKIISEGTFECKGPHALSHVNKIEIFQKDGIYKIRFHYVAPFGYGYSTENFLEREYVDHHGVFHQKDVLKSEEYGFSYVKQTKISRDPYGYHNISYLIHEQGGKLYFKYNSTAHNAIKAYPRYKTTVHYNFELSN